MLTTYIALCAVPKVMWEALDQGDGTPPSIALLVRDALSIEKRLHKEVKVNLENERVRYTLCCKQIEAIVRSRMHVLVNRSEFATLIDSGQFPAQTLDVTYLDILRRIRYDDGLRSRATDARMGATFYPPGCIEEHAQAFQQMAQELSVHEAPSVQKRNAFFKFAARNDCGVVEIQSACLPTGEGDTHPFEFAARTTQVASHPQGTRLHSDVSVVRSSIGYTGGWDESMSLRKQLTRAIADPNSAVDFSNYRNDVIIEVLHEFVYHPMEPSEKPVEIRVLYADGSEAKPFPLRCLPSHAEPNMTGSVTIRAALMSMRHLELDSKVDIAWLRNREVSKSRPLAESDDYCYTKTLEQFREIAQHYDRLVLLLHQTGFEPAVLGFYRGLTQVLTEINAGKHLSLRSLVVRPYLYINQNVQKGTPWY